MTIQGSLTEMSPADLIQHACLDGRTTRLTLRRDDQELDLHIYIQEGQLVHAQMGDQVGEQVVYAGLAWDHGSFALEPDVPAPARSIERSYAGVLLEGMQRIDEGRRPAPDGQPGAAPPDWEPPGGHASPAELVSRLRQIGGVEGVVLAARDGVVIAHDTPDHPDKSGAIAVFVGLAAGQAGETLSLGSFQWATVVTGKDTTLVIEQPDFFIGLRLGPQTSPALVGSQARELLA